MLTTDDIWAELRRRRIYAKDIAAILGVALSTVTRAINGETKDPNPRILSYIALLLGVDERQLCPGRRSPSRMQSTNSAGGRSISDRPGVPTRHPEEEAA